MKLIAFVAPLLLCTSVLSQTQITERELALMTVVGTYVNGFKEYDTSVVVIDDSVSVGVYFDAEKQTSDGAERLAQRFREQISAIIKRHGIDENVTISVHVYMEHQ